MTVVTRFAPSPTGLLHAGNYRTALFSYVFALQNKGKFILRIEDSDRARSKREYEDNILESLAWLGIPHHEFFRQSDRTEIHRSYIQKLIDSGHAFISKETPKEPGDREEVIRFKNPNTKIKFKDLIRGEIESDTTEQGDFVIARSMDEPVFHLVVVVDDHDMGVTHIIRGEDHISNTARHILIQQALGFEVPIYAHLPLLLSPDRSKLSKRKGALPMTYYRDKGYLPQALVNYMALLGWNPGTEQEVLSFDEILAQFKLEKVQKSGAIFDDEKLKWFNRQYIIKLSDADFSEHARPFLPEWIVPKSDTLKKLVPVLRDKITTFGEISTMFSATGELAFVHLIADYKKESLLWKKSPDASQAAAHLVEVKSLLGLLAADAFSADAVKQAVWPYVEAKGKGDVLWPLRMALTGQDKSPDPFVSASLLGKVESLKRIDAALEKLRG